MRHILHILLLLVGFNLSAQTDLPGEGTKAGKDVVPLTATATRAVVVGISDYQDDAIPDLQYAHKDAEAFANFLRSPAGGALDADHLKLLTNEQATTAQFDAALGWLIDESKEGDQVIIYFSGHGDVETKTRSQQGFLLCWDSPPQAYVSGAYPIFFLKEVVSTLSLENKARVVVITDACRAGKLAGNTIGGSQLTSQNLAQQFAGEIKILSCQPNEYSVEGTQWGGGRGAFSWHLVNALYGLADQDEDDRVTVKEMNRYLEDRVPAETAPEKQNPMVLGDKETRLAKVAPEILAAMRKSMGDQMLSFSPVNNRGLEDDILAGVDTSVRALYRLFQKALNDKAFFEPAGACADVYYEKLAIDPGLARLHNSMRRNYAAALQDDAQQVINIWLFRTDVQLLECIGNSLKLDPIPRQLERAAELLGHDHYMYKSLIAKKYLFEGAVLYYPKQRGSLDIPLGQKCIALYRRSLEYEPNSAVTYYRMGLSYGFHLRQLDSAYMFIEEAHRLAPSWVGPFVQFYWVLNKTTTKQTDREKLILDRAMSIDSSNVHVFGALANWYNTQGRFEEAIETYNKYEAMGGVTYPCWHIRMGGSFEKLKKIDQAEIQYRKAIALDSTNRVGFNSLGLLYNRLRRYAEAELLLLKSLALDTTDAIGWNNLGNLYRNMRRYAEAEIHLKKAIALDSTDAVAWNNLGNLYQNTRRYAEAELPLKKALDLDSTNDVRWNNLGNLYQNTRRYAEAEFHLKKAIALDSTNAARWNNLGRLYQNTRRYAEAEFHLKKAIALDSTFAYPRKHLGMACFKTNRLKEARQNFLKAIELDSKYEGAMLGMAYTFVAEGKTTEAIYFVQQAIENGEFPPTFEQLETDEDLAPLRALSEWKALMKKYFPDQVKD